MKMGILLMTQFFSQQILNFLQVYLSIEKSLDNPSAWECMLQMAKFQTILFWLWHLWFEEKKYIIILRFIIWTLKFCFVAKHTFFWIGVFARNISTINPCQRYENLLKLSLIGYRILELEWIYSWSKWTMDSKSTSNICISTSESFNGFKNSLKWMSLRLSVHFNNS